MKTPNPETHMPITMHVAQATARVWNDEQTRS
jgi:hypothetical protein